MSRPFYLLLLLSSYFTLLLVHANPNPNPNPNPTLSSAHKQLATFGFPAGLLPSDVSRYSINSTTGDFLVSFGDTCKITLPPDNYVATFYRTVKGRIVKNRIAELEGIRVRALFKWWAITGIRSAGEELVFEVGMVTAKYPAKNFEQAPACEGRRADS